MAIRLVTGAPVKKLAFPSLIGSLILAIITGGVVQQVVRDGIYHGSAWAINSARDERMVSDRDLKGFDFLAKQPHAYEGYIYGNPDEGAGWMYAYNGLPAFFKHYLWPDTTIESATNRLYWHPMRLGAGNFDDPNEANMVDTAAYDLNIKYIYIGPPHFWSFQLPRPDFEEGLMDTPGVTPIYRDHEVGIYALNYAFTDDELEKMRKNTTSPDPLPPLKTKGEAGVAANESDWNKPYFHRPKETNRGRDSHFEWLQQQKPNDPTAPVPEQAPSPADAKGDAKGGIVNTR